MKSIFKEKPCCLFSVSFILNFIVNLLQMSHYSCFAKGGSIERLIKFFIKTAIFPLFFITTSNASQIKSINVLAEPNLVPALTKISRIYSQKNSVIVSVGFAAATNSINDIDSGEPADVFISAHQDWLLSLKQKGLIDIYSVIHIASDDLVLATSKDNLSAANYSLEKNLDLEESLKIINHNHLSLIVDSEETSIGKYARHEISELHLKDLRLFAKSSDEKSSVISLLENSPDGYAILFASQVTNDEKLKILSRKNSQHIFYQALVIAGDNMEAAREFLKFLKTAPAKAIFEESGLIVE